MDINIVFKLTKDTITISSIKKTVDYKSLNNTNVIDLKELKFSTSYIKENFELVSEFLAVAIIKKDIKYAQINNMDIANISMQLINSWSHIEKVTFKPDKKINFELCFLIMDNKYLKEVNCYEMPTPLIERLDVNKKIKIVTRHKYNYNSKFMVLNNLNSYSDIYYKKLIIINGEFNNIDIEDFQLFMTINDRLKKIKIINYTNEILTTIIDAIINDKKENILISINEKNNDLTTIYNSVNYLKKRNRKYFEENNITFKLNYSKEYKDKNIFKEINLKMFSFIIISIAILSILMVGINYYSQYRDRNKIQDVLIDLDRIIENNQEFITIDDNESDIEYIDINEDDLTTTTKKKSNYVSAYYTNFDQVFDKLLQINADTVGWIQVNNTKINYPVVQKDTNSYYLTHDFYRKKNSMGWIFMDYRNNPVDLDRNTIIYGHNIKQGIMFGTIKNMMNSSWYNKASNQIITFNTPTKNMKFQIFSLYKINETEDYLKNSFSTDEEYMDFLNMIKGRSIKNFNVELNPNSKIITLSTCFSHSTRHVVHAVLIDDIEDEEPIEEYEQTENNTE